MKLHLALLTALCCSVGVHSNKQTLVAHKMRPAPTSNSASESTKAKPVPHEPNSNKASETVETSFDSSEDPEPTLERQPVEAQVILSNVDIDDLTAEETMFFESALRKAIQLAQDQEQGQQDEVTIGAILVENGHGAHKNNNRALRKGELQYLFSIWAILETFRCYLCPMNDDYYNEAPTPAPTPKSTWEVDDDYISWCNDNLAARYGGGRRHLGLSDSNTSLDDVLCQLLREGPYERFHSVGKCALGVAKW